MRKRNGCALVLLCVFTLGWRVAAQQVPAWGGGIAPFAFALIGDMPYGEPRETPFARLVAEINRDNDIDFVMHAGDIKGGQRAVRRRAHQASVLAVRGVPARIYTPGDNEW